MPPHRSEFGRGTDGETEPYAYESVDSESDAPVVRGRERRARRLEPRVEAVRMGGVVREIVVYCPCGSCTRVRIEYDQDG